MEPSAAEVVAAAADEVGDGDVVDMRRLCREGRACRGRGLVHVSAVLVVVQSRSTATGQGAVQARWWDVAERRTGLVRPTKAVKDDRRRRREVMVGVKGWE